MKDENEARSEEDGDRDQCRENVGDGETVITPQKARIGGQSEMIKIRSMFDFVLALMDNGQNQI